MRSTAVWTTAIASSFGLALAAQTAVGTGRVPPEAGMQGTQAAVTTVTGCLHRADRDGRYRLTNITTRTGGEALLDATRFAPTLSAAGTLTYDQVPAGPWLESKDLSLRTDVPSVRFDGHAGHEIEVTGTLEPAAPMGTGGMTGTPAVGAASRPATTMSAPTFNVNVLRLIGKKCR